ncbi:MAG: hypothetical protein LPJ91_09995 [Pseudazoarcus pumilus]|nr:hypothetical protein [Pseudazoarcus pumilus]
MNTARLSLLLAVVLLAPCGIAQTPDPAPADDPLPDARKAGDKPYRYPMPAIAQTVREVQHATQAMLLREYCADEKIPDQFVNQRLAEFSRQTGRAEDCRTLLDY